MRVESQIKAELVELIRCRDANQNSHFIIISPDSQKLLNARIEALEWVLDDE